jgi:hypothetical protein
MAAVRQRWLSARAVSLHAAALVVVSGCTIAAWWQVNRAQDGNQLSFLYSVMWPVFGILGLCFWWMLIHTDYDTVGLKGMRRQTQQALESAAPPMDIAASATSPTAGGAIDTDPRLVPGAAEDPELAAYNARLAELSAKGPKTWRTRDPVVVRRAQ